MGTQKCVLLFTVRRHCWLLMRIKYIFPVNAKKTCFRLIDNTLYLCDRSETNYL